MASIQFRLDNWFLRNLNSLKTSMRVVFGAIWAIDGVLKFQPGVTDNIVQMIDDTAKGQPAWLGSWFKFWVSTVSSNPQFYVTLMGVTELALSLALILGFMRKIAYTFGFVISFLIWSVPEGFGGPYGPSSTDIGTGIVYSFVFLFLMLVNATFGPSKYSLDHLIEKRWSGWRRIAEIRSTAPST